MEYRFDEMLEDCTKMGTKIPASDYLSEGLYPIVDQGQKEIAGYRNSSEGLFAEVPAIVFGDHTRALKYVEQPCFLSKSLST